MPSIRPAADDAIHVSGRLLLNGYTGDRASRGVRCDQRRATR